LGGAPTSAATSAASTASTASAAPVPPGTPELARSQAAVEFAKDLGRSKFPPRRRSTDPGLESGADRDHRPTSVHAL